MAWAGLQMAPARAQMAAAVPQSGLKTVDVTVRAGDGRTHRFKAELAATPGEQAIGMMYRTAVPKGTGMLFPRRPAERAAFWMRNTYVPLDIIYIAPGGVIESIHNALPLTETLIASRGPVEAVLEIGAGEAARLGIGVGDKVEWRAPR